MLTHRGVAPPARRSRTRRAGASSRARGLLPHALLWLGLAATPVLQAQVNDGDPLDALTSDQAAFVRSGMAYQFLPQRQLEHELATRDPEAVGRLIDDLMALAEDMAYDEERDMGAIPLNMASKRFGAPSPTPAPLREAKRDPGPFSVHRYQFPRSGVPTFAGAPVAIFPEDLVAGDVDVAIIGVPSNMSSGRRDSAGGPDALRALDTLAHPDAQSLVSPMESLSVVDYGNFATDGLSAERTVDHVTEMVAATAATGTVPMLVGGDTSLLYAGVKGVVDAAAKAGRGGDDSDAAIGLLHFSAHPDAQRFDDHVISDDQALFALLDQGVIAGEDTVVIGLRGPAVTRDTLAWLRDQAVRYHTLTEIRTRGFDRVLRSALSEVKRGPDRFYVSVDVSVVAPSELVAAGRVAPDGLRADQVARAIREVCATKEIAGFEVTDLAPALDFSRLSTLNAGALLNACLAGMAVRREGLDPDYIHPLVLGHGQR